MTNEASAIIFANSIVRMVNQFHLDGVDIDDEYSECQTNNTSMIMIAEAIKTNPLFAGKLLTKALFNDAPYFAARYKGHKLAEFLDYGFEMSYDNSNFAGRLAPYLVYGMTPQKLMLGGWTERPFPSPVALGSYTLSNNLAGTMVYDITTHSQNYLSEVADGEYSGDGVIVLPNCLQ
jgi:hypothetical protein